VAPHSKALTCPSKPHLRAAVRNLRATCLIHQVVLGHIDFLYCMKEPGRVGHADPAGFALLKVEQTVAFFENEVDNTVNSKVNAFAAGTSVRPSFQKVKLAVADDMRVLFRELSVHSQPVIVEFLLSHIGLTLQKYEAANMPSRVAGLRYFSHVSSFSSLGSQHVRSDPCILLQQRTHLCLESERVRDSDTLTGRFGDPPWRNRITDLVKLGKTACRE
jgi:hypothetical protein